jgi:hypothetical protein
MGPCADRRTVWRSWTAWAVAAWSVALLVISTRAALVPVAQRSVYWIYADAGRHWRALDDVYRINPFYRYSPAVSEWFAAWTLLPDQAGAVLWRLLGAGVFLAALGWWARDVLPRRLTRTEYAALFLLALPLSVNSLNNGQVNLLLAGLHLAALAAVARDRWNLAAVCLAAACLLKIYPLALALLLVAAFPRKLGPRLTLAVGLGLVLPFVLRPTSFVVRQYGMWFSLLGRDDRSPLPLSDWYRDAKLLLHVWDVPLNGGGYQALQLGTAAVVAAVCLAGRWAGWPRRQLLTTTLALGTCWMLLFGPATESSTFALLAPSLAWAVVEAWQRPGWRRGPVLAGFGLLISTYVAGWFPVGSTYHSLGIHPLATLVLFAAFVAQALCDLRRRERGEEMLALPPARAA